VFGKAVVREMTKKEEDPKKPAKKGWIEYKDPETLSTTDVSDANTSPWCTVSTVLVFYHNKTRDLKFNLCCTVDPH